MEKRREREIELEPDAWERFERAVDVVAKSPPQHRLKDAKKSTKHRRQKKIKPHAQS
jgi:hypothetical protein